MTAKATNPERAIQAAILRYLANRDDVRVWRQQTGGAVPIETVNRAIVLIRSGNIEEGILLLRRSLTHGESGMGDLFGIYKPNGKFISIEVKTDTGTESKEQKNWARMVKDFNAITVLARSVEDVGRVLDQSR